MKLDNKSNIDLNANELIDLIIKRIELIEETYKRVGVCSIKTIWEVIELAHKLVREILGE